jgi:hypothetical protein
MRRDERLKAQILKEQALCRAWENQFQCFEKNGISGGSVPYSFLHDRSVVFRGRLARNRISWRAGLIVDFDGALVLFGLRSSMTG